MNNLIIRYQTFAIDQTVDLRQCKFFISINLSVFASPIQKPSTFTVILFWANNLKNAFLL